MRRAAPTHIAVMQVPRAHRRSHDARRCIGSFDTELVVSWQNSSLGIVVEDPQTALEASAWKCDCLPGQRRSEGKSVGREL